MGGPNGAIMTSLNIFATKFDQVVRLLEKQQNQLSEARSQQKRQSTVKTQAGCSRTAEASSGSDPNPNTDVGVCKPTVCDDEDTPVDYVLIDTPGQIEVFTWSASGAIITESL